MTHPAKVPVHPQPGIYETTVVSVPCPDGSEESRLYTHHDYEAQRAMRFGEVADLKEASTVRMLEAGWTRNEEVGCLVPPMLRVAEPAPEPTVEPDSSEEADVASMGTVKVLPYVGDSSLVSATCKHGDYENAFKGATLQRGQRALAEHYAAKHGTPKKR